MTGPRWDGVMTPEPTDDPTPGMQIWGWTTPGELKWLMRQAKRMTSVVEIGSLHGRSAFALATACPGIVYCVDPWDDPDDYGYPSFMRQCGDVLPNVVPIRGYSPDAATATRAVSGSDFDMVFIDGDHDYDAVKADVERWLPLTRKLICGHDYNNFDGGYPGVQQYVDEAFGERVRVAPGTAIWYVEL